MPRSDNNVIWTIGHSTHSYEEFVRLLRSADITAVADVRSAPYSRHFSQFNQNILKDELKADGIAYSFLGEELGGRPKNSKYYCDGVADYEKMATSEEFHDGIFRLVEGSTRYRIALMCSEHDPLDCHRCLLVGRSLNSQKFKVNHILGNGTVLPQSVIEERLLNITRSQNGDLFLQSEEKLANAYRLRSQKVAYVEPNLAKASGF